MEKNKCPFNDSYGAPLFEGDKVKVGSIKGLHVVEYDKEFDLWRLRNEYSNSGIAFKFLKGKITKQNLTKADEKERLAVALYRAFPNDFIYHEDYLAAVDVLINAAERNKQKYEAKSEKEASATGEEMPVNL